MKRVITVTGNVHGAGATTVAEMIASMLPDYGFISSGQIFREIAEKEGKTLEEMERGEIDIKVDMEVMKRAREGRWVVNSMMAPFLLPDSLKILVFCPPEIAGYRVYGKRREGERIYRSPEEATRALVERTAKDLEVFRELSGKAPEPLRSAYRRAVMFWGDPGYFDFVVDNSDGIRATERQVRKILKRTEGL